MTATIDAGAVLLDMDGTLVDSTAVVNEIWTRWAAEHQLDADDVLAICHGRQGYETMAILLPDRPHEDNLTENAAMLAAETDNVEGIIAIPGAGEFLAALRDVPHALVTSADTTLATVRMLAAGLPLPDLSITAEMVSRSKPHPEGFLKAAADLGVDRADCVVFEDSGAGIEAGRAAGMTVVGVGAAAAGHDPDHHLIDLASVTVTTADGRARISLG
ncbi:HAD-IA family hydrolase [Gordonia caeni]|uniref:HAD family hydrolase n=1 Tax=Gordonia caeni TaxID=1007097 RepID=A0ABP7PGN0_9ACTN